MAWYNECGKDRRARRKQKRQEARKKRREDRKIKKNKGKERMLRAEAVMNR